MEKRYNIRKIREHRYRLIEGEKKGIEAAKKEPKLGPKMRLKQLLELGYPDEEAKKKLKSEFTVYSQNDILIENWIKEIKNEIKQKNMARNNEGELSNER